MDDKIIEQRHLKNGDEFPKELSVNNDKLILLSMRFCPYAQRIHLILDAKQIPYDTININLMDKPKWLNNYSPLGKVPALGLTNELINQQSVPYIYESLLIADYLDGKFPKLQLHPTDELAKIKDRLLIEQFNPIISAYYRIVLNGRNDEALLELFDRLDAYEKELCNRGEIYFCGKQPGMLDFMIWPWCERLAVIKLVAGVENYELKQERFPLLKNWISLMISLPAVKKSYLDETIHGKYYEQRKIHGVPDYDMLIH